MAKIIVAVLAAVCLAASLATNIERTGPQLQYQVGVKQHLDSGPGGETDHWMVDVEQNTEPCEGEDCELETVFDPSAPPSTRGKQTKRRVARSASTTATCPDPTATCRSAPPGYQRFDGVGFYRVSTEAKTWEVAKQTCQDEGGHLLVINSQTEADAIKTLIRDFPSTSGSSNQEYLLLGAQRIGNTYFTVLGDALSNTGFERWSPHEPSGGDEFCLSLYRTNNLFNDISCDRKLGFICEYPSIGGGASGGGG